MTGYYDPQDLAKFGDIGRTRPDLFQKFLAWYSATQEAGALGKREKMLAGLAVAHVLQCPYCIDAFTRQCLETGSDLEQMTEVVHLASAIRGGASLIHGLQMQHSHDKLSM